MKLFYKKIALMVSVITLLSTASMANETQEPDIANGAQVWADVCMRCHNLRPPEDLSKRAWKYSMQHMRVRAGLTGSETRDILAFIVDSKTAEDSK